MRNDLVETEITVPRDNYKDFTGCPVTLLLCGHCETNTHTQAAVGGKKKKKIVFYYINISNMHLCTITALTYFNIH